MKLSIKLLLFALMVGPMFLMTSCEENLQVSCDDFSISIDYSIIDSTSVTLTAVPEGGTPDFSYLWSTGESSQSINVTAIQTYSVTVTDDSDCTASLDFTVDADTTVTTNCDSLSAYIFEEAEATSGTLTAITMGGNGSYTYEWSTGETTEAIVVTESGTYSVVVTDEAGCSVVAVRDYINGDICNYDVSIVLEINPISFDTTLTVVIDTFDMDGTYTYLWNTGETTQSIGTVGVGTYTVTMTDGNGCLFTVVYVYEWPNLCDGVTVEILAFQDSTSTLISLATDDVFDTYQWSNGETSPVIAVNQGDGSFSVTVTDSNDCMAEDTIEI